MFIYNILHNHLHSAEKKEGATRKRLRCTRVVCDYTTKGKRIESCDGEGQEGCVAHKPPHAYACLTRTRPLQKFQPTRKRQRRVRVGMKIDVKSVLNRELCGHGAGVTREGTHTRDRRARVNPYKR